MLLPVIATTACWGGEPWTPTEGPSAWRPAPDAPAGWSISTIDSPFACPDGVTAVATVLAPDAPDAEGYDVAIIVPDGSFDYVLTPDLADPLAGAHFQDPSRLDHSWAVRHAWAIAGVYRTGDPAVAHSGGLSVALARRGVAVVIPSLCWGDYSQAVGDSSGIEGFERRGADMVTWAWDTATTDPAGLGLGSGAAARRVLVALGEGGRGAATIVRSGATAPTALLIDSADDDLGVYWDDPGAWADHISGLDRIYPGGPTQARNNALAYVEFPPATALVYSSVDPRLPAGAIDTLATRVEQAGGRVDDTQIVRHVQTAGDDDLADELIGFLIGDPVDDTDP